MAPAHAECSADHARAAGTWVGSGSPGQTRETEQMTAPLYRFYRLLPPLGHLLAATAVVALGLAGLVTLAAGQGAQPGLVVTAPTSGDSLAGPDATVRFTVSGLQIVPSSVPLEAAGKRP